MCAHLDRMLGTENTYACLQCRRRHSCNCYRHGNTTSALSATTSSKAPVSDSAPLRVLHLYVIVAAADGIPTPMRSLIGPHAICIWCLKVFAARELVFKHPNRAKICLDVVHMSAPALDDTTVAQCDLADKQRARDMKAKGLSRYNAEYPVLQQLGPFRLETSQALASLDRTSH